MGLVRLRFQRYGYKRHMFLRLVAADSRRKRDGKYIEQLGTFDPMKNKELNKIARLNVERIKYWLSVGAQPSPAVGRLLAMAGLIPDLPRRTNLTCGDLNDVLRQNNVEKVIDEGPLLVPDKVLQAAKATDLSVSEVKNLEELRQASKEASREYGKVKNINANKEARKIKTAIEHARTTKLKRSIFKKYEEERKNIRDLKVACTRARNEYLEAKASMVSPNEVLRTFLEKKCDLNYTEIIQSLEMANGEKGVTDKDIHDELCKKLYEAVQFHENRGKCKVTDFVVADTLEEALNPNKFRESSISVAAMTSAEHREILEQLSKDDEVERSDLNLDSATQS
mmetsp:Transcript_19583/g.29220  ORF Transcript_19583/g.29220 Transcript_19583/m.29220 type:complete len:339 (-) Transcript_19583:106-1122(-)